MAVSVNFRNKEPSVKPLQVRCFTRTCTEILFIHIGLYWNDSSGFIFAVLFQLTQEGGRNHVYYKNTQFPIWHRSVILCTRQFYYLARQHNNKITAVTKPYNKNTISELKEFQFFS